MQSVSSRIWTYIAVSISNDDNHYTTDTSQNWWLHINLVSVPRSGFIVFSVLCQNPIICFLFVFFIFFASNFNLNFFFIFIISWSGMVKPTKFQVLFFLIINSLSDCIWRSLCIEKCYTPHFLRHILVYEFTIYEHEQNLISFSVTYLYLFLPFRALTSIPFEPVCCFRLLCLTISSLSAHNPAYYIFQHRENWFSVSPYGVINQALDSK